MDWYSHGFYKQIISTDSQIAVVVSRREKIPKQVWLWRFARPSIVTSLCIIARFLEENVSLSNLLEWPNHFICDPTLSYFDKGIFPTFICVRETNFRLTRLFKLWFFCLMCFRFFICDRIIRKIWKRKLFHNSRISKKNSNKNKYLKGYALGVLEEWVRSPDLGEPLHRQQTIFWRHVVRQA